MHWVCTKLEVVLYDQLDGAIGTKVVDVVVSWEGEVASVRINQNRIVVVATESLTVHEPDKCSAIASESDVDGFVCWRGWIWSDRAQGDRVRQGVIATVGEFGCCQTRRGCWNGSCVSILVIDGSYGLRGDAVSQRAPCTKNAKVGAHPVRVTWTANGFDLGDFE